METDTFPYFSFSRGPEQGDNVGPQNVYENQKPNKNPINTKYEKNTK